jgi:TM2 domain-containing membrane protein YozV
VVVAEATFCKECGAPLTAGLVNRTQGFNPIVAAALSLIPGLGHLYRGRFGRGVLWFFGVTLAYTMGPTLGLLIHLICAANAALSGTIEENVFSRRRTRGGPAPFDSES